MCQKEYNRCPNENMMGTQHEALYIGGGLLTTTANWHLTQIYNPPLLTVCNCDGIFSQ